ncbi:hypothetical protein [Moraxella sp. ZY210820]|uniref:hypothetical protein n=1 Tax=unclassified Moraxella TaxID=2685852 RepID=UPI00272EEDF5|nr:hypothetical protein [Moraxella sp. ZY210820]WLF83569.1 hypothetical protein LU301_09960 [Moraxella sp. ZY210820]
MKSEINIAIFGMSLSLLDEIKSKIRLMIPNHVQVNWTNIAEPNLDCIMINDVFFSSANIQNLIQNKRLNYLRLVKDETKGGELVGDVLYVPVINTAPLNQWINQYVLNGETATHVHVSSPIATTNTTATISSTVKPLNSTTASNHNVVSEKILDDIFNDKNGNIQLFDSIGNLAIINAKSEQVWLNSTRSELKTDGAFNYTYVTAQNLNVVKDVAGIDLHLWIFNLAWNSSNVLNLPVSKQKFYKLIYWPQAEVGKDRRDIIRLSAAFAKGASIEQVENFTKVNTQTIEKFISACLVARLIEEVPVEQAKLVKFVVPKEQATPQQTEQASAVSSFFGRLRKRLGF